MNSFKLIVNVIEKVMMWVAGSLVIMSSFLAFSDAILRTFLNISFPFLPTLEVWGIIWTTFLMGGILLKTEAHISVDFLLKDLRGASQRFFRILNWVVTAAFCFLATWAGVEYVKFLRDLHVTRDLIKSIPYWVVCIIIPIGMAISTLYAICMLIVCIYSHPVDQSRD